MLVSLSPDDIILIATVFYSRVLGPHRTFRDQRLRMSVRATRHSTRRRFACYEIGGIYDRAWSLLEIRSISGVTGAILTTRVGVQKSCIQRQAS